MYYFFIWVPITDFMALKKIFMVCFFFFFFLTIENHDGENKNFFIKKLVQVQIF